jgi:hypothetical protein
MIGWVVPPPAFPAHVAPGTANRSEHVSSENPGANILEASRSEVLINPRCATVGLNNSTEAAFLNNANGGLLNLYYFGADLW